MKSWVNFWNKNHSIYVNSKHKQVHSEKILNDIGCWIPSSDCAILDYGCGEALYATGLLAKCSHLTLVDTSQNTRTQIKSRLNNSDNVKILSPEDCASLKNEIQY